jgi:hypothetical protein
MKIGVTGTRSGMTQMQYSVCNTIFGPHITEVHHGDCIGADLDFAEIAKRNGLPVVLLTVDPIGLEHENNC